MFFRVPYHNLIFSSVSSRLTVKLDQQLVLPILAVGRKQLTKTLKGGMALMRSTGAKGPTAGFR